ncbi:hypothetical protein ACYOEI_29230, partial [Singulisphaera rosea]
MSRNVVGSAKLRRLVSFVVLLLSLGWTSLSTAQTPKAKPVTQPSSSLTQLIPAEKLAVYLEFQGFAARDQAWRRSALYKILNQTTLGELFEDLATQAFQAISRVGDEARPAIKISFSLLNKVLRQGFVLAMNIVSEEEFHTLFAIRGEARTGIREDLDGLFEASYRDDGGVKTIQKSGRTIKVGGKPRDGQVCWDEKGDYVFCRIKSLDYYLKAIDAKVPSAKDHPLRTDLAKSSTAFEPLVIGFFDLTAMPPVPKSAADLGLAGLKRIDLRVGFQADALMSVVRVVAPAPRKGLLALVDQPTFDLATLPPLPSGITGFSVLSVDMPRTYDRIITLVKSAGPEQASKVDAWEKSSRSALGFDLRKDLLASLGPKLASYSRPSSGRAVQPYPLLEAEITAQVRDQAAVGKVVGLLTDTLNRRISAPPPDPNASRFPAESLPRFRTFEGLRPAYTLVMNQRVLVGPFADL